MLASLFTYNELHPKIVHFPVALLMTAPLFLLLAIFLTRARRGLAFAALILMVLGTIGAWASVNTGDAAEHAVSTTPEIKAVLHQHEDLAETSALTFTILTVLMAGVVLVPLYVKKLDRPGVARISLAVVLVLLIGGNVLLAKVAHEGGRLVHEFGVSPLLSPK